MKKGIQMDLKDNVGVVIQDVFADEQVEFDTGMVITALDNIDLPHKIAIKDIKKGEVVIKYGEVMGYATREIFAGQHVHVHNCDSEKLMK